MSEANDVQQDDLPARLSGGRADKGDCMEDVKIENRRFEPDQNKALDDLSKRFAKAFGFRSQTLDVAAELAQLLRLRVSQLNHCTFCMNLHAQAAREIGRASCRERV